MVEQIARPPVIIGASLGGITAMLAAGSSDDQVASGLVLVDIVPKTNPEGSKRIGDFMRSGLEGFSSLDDVAAAIAAYTPQRNRQMNVEGLKKVVQERNGRWYWHWDPRFLSQDRTEFVARVHDKQRAPVLV